MESIQSNFLIMKMNNYPINKIINANNESLETCDY